MKTTSEKYFNVPVMEIEKLNAILARHLLWLQGDPAGSRANLSGENLAGVNLSGVNLSRADMADANLSDANMAYANMSDADMSDAIMSRAIMSDANMAYANMSGVNLSDANMSRANMSRVNLSRADMSRANMYGVNLSDAIMSRANMTDANLSDANLSDANMADANLSDAIMYGVKNAIRSIVPEKGAFVGFKKVRLSGGGFGICELQIPADAGRVSFLGSRKCRSSNVQVCDLQNMDGSTVDPDVFGLNLYNGHLHTEYRVGAVVCADKFDPDNCRECSHGISFFITRQEAVDFS